MHNDQNDYNVCRRAYRQKVSNRLVDDIFSLKFGIYHDRQSMLTSPLYVLDLGRRSL